MGEYLKIHNKIVLAILVIFLFSSSTIAQAAQCPIVVNAGEKVQLQPEAYDPDPEIGPAGRLIWGFSEPFDKTGAWQTTKGDVGIYNFFVTVSDGELSDTKHSCVEVLPNNRPPVLQPLQEVYITAGEQTTIPVSCYDPDGDKVDIEFAFRGYPVAYIYYEQPGDYSLRVTCSDGYGGVDSKTTTVHIVEAQKPQLPRPIPTVVTQPQPQQPQLIEVQQQPKPVTTCPTQTEVVQQAPQPIEVVYQQPQQTVCPQVQPKPQQVEVVQAPQQAVCPQVHPKPQQVEVVQVPQQTVCPQVHPKPQQVDVQYQQPRTTCPEVQPKPQQVEIVKPVANRCPTGYVKVQIQKTTPKPTQTQTQVPVRTRTPENVQVTYETVCKPQIKISNQPVITQTPTTTEAQKEPLTKTYIITYDRTKPTGKIEKIVRRIFKSPIERKLEISGFLKANAGCNCKEAATEAKTDNKNSPATYVI